MVNTPKGIFWMDKKGFYTYTGATSRNIPCSVQAYVFSDLNESQSYQRFLVLLNKAFDEGWVGFIVVADSNSSYINT